MKFGVSRCQSCMNCCESLRCDMFYYQLIMSRGLLLILLLFALSLACRAPGKSTATGEEKAKDEKAEAGPQEVITLTQEQVESSGIATTEVITGVVIETVSVQGRVIAPSSGQATVISPFPGRLIAASRFPRVGDMVRRGEWLASVRQELSAAEAAAIAEKRLDFDSQVKQTEQEVAQKSKDLERARILYEGGVIAHKQVQQAETDLAIARARHEMALRARAQYDALLSDSNSNSRLVRLTAPISGTITSVGAAPNQQVDNTKPIFEIVNLKTVWVEAQVFEDYLAAVRQARAVSCTTRAAPGMVFTGRLISLTHQVDPVSKTEGAIFEVINHNQVLAIGMNVEVQLPLGKTSSKLLVPASAIIQEQGHSIVFVETGPGTYERREVKVGGSQGERAIILQGLRAGEKVVSTGAQLLAGAG
jgi:cobalt-zinc-cadmium efflux system membrane fusion protein